MAHSVVSRANLPSLWYGLAYDARSKLLLAASGAESVYAVPVQNGQFGKVREIRLPGCQLAAGIAVQSGSTAVVACNQSHELVRFDFQSTLLLGRSPSGAFPYTVRALPRDRLAVSNWGDSSVSILNGRSLALIARIPTGSHPNDLLLLPGGEQLLVACSDSDSVDFVDLAQLRRDREIDLRIPGKPLSGAQPDALAYDAASRRLYVGLAAINAVSMFRLKTDEIQFEGVIPTSPDPTALLLSPKTGTLFYASGFNPKPGPNSIPGSKGYRYIGNLIGGGIAGLGPEKLKGQGTGPLLLAQQIYGAKRASENVLKVQTFSSPEGPIRHVIYAIKENRTYDQVLGDIKEGNGAPDLVLFGNHVTPNHHMLATQFVLFDNFYVDGYVSADGHLWSTAAISTDYVNKLWPSIYSDRAKGAFDATYDGDERHDHPIAAPGSGFT